MALHQQQRPVPQRQLTHPSNGPVIDTTSTASPLRPLDDSQEWVLFSPAPASTTARTQTTSTERTPRTAGLSRFSDFGSLDTAARSDQVDDDDDLTCHGSDIDEEGELDSLDDGLHAFHEPSDISSARQRLDQSGGTVLPTHDGLGTFQGSTNVVQDQLWQFERFNPRRRQRRRSSVQRRLDALEEAEEIQQDNEKTRRIEQWRMEQSRALLEEIERETRRMRRMSKAGAARSRAESTATRPESRKRSMPGSFEGNEPEQETQNTNDVAEHASFWQRFTQRVIRDLMGIDESILSVILGESLPEEADQSADAPKPKETVAEFLQKEGTKDDAHVRSWEHRLLERIARELGILVHQFSEHPGAFNSYLRTQETLDYAGFPATMLAPTTDTITDANTPMAPSSTPATAASPSALFSPTLNQHPSTSVSYSEASLWGIEEEPEDPLSATNRPSLHHPQSSNDASARLDVDREYWERELDVKMVFNFLRQRFSSRPSSPEPLSSVAAGKRPTAGEGPTSAPSARRAALIRQHHPLVGSSVSRAEQTRRKDFHHNPSSQQSGVAGSTVSSPLALAPSASASPLLRSRFGGSSSCASQSTKKSRRSRSSGGSRNYWDLGGSGVGSERAGVGIWGEV
ncbi:hypothetical protein K402DRAFT_328100 [Aulographum hederae CBS 113979]|uniref:Uncharacterized protein n=1 Tax=Aulographum hederae CBS 113979 TaxID=1176131 RepID=A0A6G1H6W5_9PEZI|nr:hypothetical protein K402DRAFT_328100 [Aulographum hederae CBS 113979]